MAGTERSLSSTESPALGSNTRTKPVGTCITSSTDSQLVAVEAKYGRVTFEELLDPQLSSISPDRLAKDIRELGVSATEIVSFLDRNRQENHPMLVLALAYASGFELQHAAWLGQIAAGQPQYYVPSNATAEEQRSMLAAAHVLSRRRQFGLLHDVVNPLCEFVITSPDHAPSMPGVRFVAKTMFHEAAGRVEDFEPSAIRLAERYVETHLQQGGRLIEARPAYAYLIRADEQRAVAQLTNGDADPVLSPALGLARDESSIGALRQSADSYLAKVGTAAARAQARRPALHAMLGLASIGSPSSIAIARDLAKRLPASDFEFPEWEHEEVQWYLPAEGLFCLEQVLEVGKQRRLGALLDRSIQSQRCSPSYAHRVTEGVIRVMRSDALRTERATKRAFQLLGVFGSEGDASSIAALGQRLDATEMAAEAIQRIRTRPW